MNQTITAFDQTIRFLCARVELLSSEITHFYARNDELADQISDIRLQQQINHAEATQRQIWLESIYKRMDILHLLP
jgi:hypothetical protein